MGKLQGLTDKFPIVDLKTGNPNSYFIRFLQDRGIGQADLESALEILLTKEVVGTDGTVLVTNGEFSNEGNIDLSADVQAILDLISAVRGTILFRGAADWQALPPGVSGQVLSTSGPGLDPLWITPSGGSFTYNGCRTRLTSDIAGVNVSGGSYQIPFSNTNSTEDYDTNSWHDPVTNNTRFTVPTGITKVDVSFSCELDLVAGSDIILEVWKNGAAIPGAAFSTIPRFNVGPGAYGSISAIGIPVVATDYLSARVFCTDASITIKAPSTNFAVRGY